MSDIDILEQQIDADDVPENQDANTLGDTDVDGAVDVDGFTASEESPEVEDALSDVDALIARLTEVEGRTRDVDVVKHRVNSELNRLQNIQSRVDKLAQDAENTASVDRVGQLESMITELSGVIMSSDIVDDSLKLSMKERELERRLKSIEHSNTPAPVEQSTEMDPSTKQLWDDATNFVSERASAANIDPSNIPQHVWTTGAGLGSPARAADYVLAWLNSQNEDAGKVEQIAAKKRAAGNGTPQRSGQNQSIESLIQAYGEGGDITVTEKRRVMEHLGL